MLPFDDLPDRVAQFESLAEGRGLRLHSGLPGAASQRSLDALTKDAGALPPSLLAFFEKHDGLHLKFARAGLLGATLLEFTIHPAGEINRRSAEFRTLVDVSDDDDEDRKAGCFEIAELSAPAQRIVFARALSRANDECAIVLPSLESVDWVTDMLKVPNATIVADSFGEFFDKAFRHMTETERGFAYWNPDFDAFAR